MMGFRAEFRLQDLSQFQDSAIHTLTNPRLLKPPYSIREKIHQKKINFRKSISTSLASVFPVFRPLLLDNHTSTHI